MVDFKLAQLHKIVHRFIFRREACGGKFVVPSKTLRGGGPRRPLIWRLDLRSPSHICPMYSTCCCTAIHCDIVENCSTTIWKIWFVTFTFVYMHSPSVMSACSHMRLKHAVNSTTLANTISFRANCISSTWAQKKNLNPWTDNHNEPFCEWVCYIEFLIHYCTYSRPF